MENNRAIPGKWFDAFVAELASDNKAYVDNVRRTLKLHGVLGCWHDSCGYASSVHGATGCSLARLSSCGDANDLRQLP
jgi:hypothetical protein